MGGNTWPGCRGIAYVEAANFRSRNLPSGVQLRGEGIRSVPLGAEQVPQISVGEPPPAGYTSNEPGALRPCPGTHRPSGETPNGIISVVVGIVFCNSPPSSLMR